MKQKWGLIALFLLIGANLLFSIYLYRVKSRGFYAPHGDGVARAVLSYGIASGWDFPADSIFRYWKTEGVFPHKVWPPFQFYFNAGVYKICGDLLLTPFLSNTVFSTGVILFLYLLIRNMLPGKAPLPVIGALYYTSFSGFKMIDLSGLDQTMLNFFIIGGLYFWLKYRRDRRKVTFIYLAALLFVISSSIRFEGWFYVTVFELFILGEFMFSLRRSAKLYLLPVMLIPLLFIIVWLVHQWAAYGELFFLNYHHNEALAGGDKLYGRESLVFKAAFYPILLFRTAPVPVGVVLLSLIVLKKPDKTVREYGGFVLVEFALLIGSVLYTGVPHGPWRIILTNLLLLLPVSIVGTYYLFAVFFKGQAALRLTTLLFVFLSCFQIIHLPQNLPNSISEEVSRVGDLMKGSVANGLIGEDDRIFVELVRKQPWGEWDTQKLSIFAPRHAITFSLTGSSPEKTRKMFEEYNIKMAVLWSADAQRLLSPLCPRIFSTEHYSVYLVPGKMGEKP